MKTRRIAARDLIPGQKFSWSEDAEPSFEMVGHLREGIEYLCGGDLEYMTYTSADHGDGVNVSAEDVVTQMIEANQRGARRIIESVEHVEQTWMLVKASDGTYWQLVCGAWYQIPELPQP